jgi:hypothetical protein
MEEVKTISTFICYLAGFVKELRSPVRQLNSDPNAVRFGVWAILLVEGRSSRCPKPVTG